MIKVSNPPKSATSRGPKQAYLKPNPYFITESISSLEITPCSTRYKASLKTANWILFAANPKTSFCTITGFYQYEDLIL